VPRPFALVATADQWHRAAHQGTGFDPEARAVELAWSVEPAFDQTSGVFPGPAGLAFDPWCRLYHSRPEAGQVERVLWAAPEPAGEEVDLFAAPPGGRGQFEAAQAPAPLADPIALACDEDGRLFVAEAGAGRLLVYDLWERRLLRRVRVPGRPLDLAADGRRVWVLLGEPPGLVVMEARTGPRSAPLPLPPDVAAPSRLALCSLGPAFALESAGSPDARIVPLAEPAGAFAVPGATDLAFQCPGTLVVARLPGQDFLRFAVAPDSRQALGPLRARGYDGRGVARAPDGRIAFWSERGLRHAVPAPRRYGREGRVVTFRLDSGAFQTAWGRLFVDACVPRGAGLRVHCAVSDEPEELMSPELPRTPPSNAGSLAVHRPDLSPPMPPLALVPGPGEVGQPLHRRETDLELPWVRRADTDPFETYEAPILAPHGRYLWVTLELRGDGRSSPRVRALRAEHPSHDLLRRLPRVYSREETSAEFLRRYLMPLEGLVEELAGLSFGRRALLDPESVPAEALPWLAGFLGLVLDERWPVEVRRQLIAEAAWLFRFRGTVPGLLRFLEIVLGRRPVLIEHFRVRGLGGAFAGGPGPLVSRAVLGAGFRVGGAVGRAGEATVAGTGDLADAFETHAHRFSLVLPVELDPERLAMVEHLLEIHRPAHTLFELCTVETGVRVGLRLHLGLTSLVGRTGGFGTLQVGGSLLGRNRVVGRPGPGTLPGASRAGQDSRVG
jgi:phage tail-like protein